MGAELGDRITMDAEVHVMFHFRNVCNEDDLCAEFPDIESIVRNLLNIEGTSLLFEASSEDVYLGEIKEWRS